MASLVYHVFGHWLNNYGAAKIRLILSCIATSTPRGCYVPTPQMAIHILLIDLFSRLFKRAYVIMGSDWSGLSTTITIVVPTELSSYPHVRCAFNAVDHGLSFIIHLTSALSPPSFTLSHLSAFSPGSSPGRASRRSTTPDRWQCTTKRLGPPPCLQWLCPAGGII